MNRRIWLIALALMLVAIARVHLANGFFIGNALRGLIAARLTA